MQGNDCDKPRSKKLGLKRNENKRDRNNKERMIREMDWDGVLTLLNSGY